MPADIRIPSLAALARRYGTTPRRRTLLRRLRATLAHARACGFRGDVYIGGSFTTAKAEPGDVDVVLDLTTTPPRTVRPLADYLCSNLDRLRAIGVDVFTAHDALPGTDMRRLWRRTRPLVVVSAV